MGITLHWFLPTSGDSRDVVGVRKDLARRPPTIDYLAQIARAAEQLGFVGALTPTGLQCDDAWLTTAALSRESERLKFLVAFRPGILSPLLAAHQAATYQRITGGRLLLNIVTGGDSTEQRRFGDWLTHDERYDRTDEFLTIMKRAMLGQPFDFEGQYYRVEQAAVNNPPDPQPSIYFGGASSAAERVAARHAEVYLMWGETTDMVKERIDRMRKLAAENGRSVRFGIRLHVITRDTSEAAWAEANRLISHMSKEDVARAQAAFLASESVGQHRMSSLHGGALDHLEIYPNLWAGIGLVRGGAGTAFVGSHDEVADRVEEYHRLGLDEFILSGYPHLEEAYWFGENVIPRLRRRELLDHDVTPLDSRELAAAR